MNIVKYRKFIPVIAIVLVALGGGLEKLGIDIEALLGGNNTSTTNQTSQSSNTQSRRSSSQHWSDTRPEINLRHVFEGEINRKGKPVGYHSRPGGRDAANARIKSVKAKPNRDGVYTANIEILDGNQWKGKFSSFFPDSMSEDDVVNAILNAYNNSKNPNKQPWSGPSGHGFQIQGYTTSRGGINTAFPIYVNN